jgi:sugar lactone lactonase YvrE
MSIDRQDPRLDAIVDADVQRETLGSVFGFLEGPIWHPREQHLTFSDIPNDRLHRFHPTDGFSVYREPSNIDIVADGFRREAADEDRPGIADGRCQGFGFAGGNLKMLRRQAVDKRHGLVQ